MRITNYPQKNTIEDDDVFLVDNEDGTTSSITGKNLKDAILNFRAVSDIINMGANKFANIAYSYINILCNENITKGSDIKRLQAYVGSNLYSSFSENVTNIIPNIGQVIKGDKNDLNKHTYAEGAMQTYGTFNIPLEMLIMSSYLIVIVGTTKYQLSVLMCNNVSNYLNIASNINGDEMMVFVSSSGIRFDNGINEKLEYRIYKIS